MKFYIVALKGLVVLAGLSCSIVSADIFGQDDRSDLRRGSRDYQFSSGVAVGVLNSLWTPVNKHYEELWADPLADFMCQDEAFSKQKSVSYACSGFLVGEDLLVTAGHCGVNTGEIFNSSEDYCEAYTWMFDYHKHTNTKRVPTRNIYKCKEIIYAVNIDGEPYRDFTLIRLDRKVTGRKIYQLAEDEARLTDPVRMMGHPMGMPMKLADNAVVIEAEPQKNSYLTDLDAFSGNSGSPVFNEQNKVIGVLVAGNPAISTYQKPGESCERYNRCDADGKNCKAISINANNQGFPNTFSEVQKISLYADLIKKNQK